MRLPPYEVPEADRDLLDCGVVLSSREREESERAFVCRAYRLEARKRRWRDAYNANKRATRAAQPKAPRLSAKQRESRALAQHWGGGG